MIDSVGPYGIGGISMARPRLTTESFLSHLFRPSKNALPSGIRKTTLKGKKGQKRARINSWNKMPGKNQEILRRAGLQDAFLRGDVTVTEAKRRLRIDAANQGIVKPLRRRAPSKAVSDDIYGVFRHMDRILQTDRKNPDHLRMNAVMMSPQQRVDVKQISTFDEFRAEASSPSERWMTTFDDGVTRSVLWYH